MKILALRMHLFFYGLFYRSVMKKIKKDPCLGLLIKMWLDTWVETHPASIQEQEIVSNLYRVVIDNRECKV